jgi:hypothetical protein
MREEVAVPYSRFHRTRVPKDMARGAIGADGMRKKKPGCEKQRAKKRRASNTGEQPSTDCSLAKTPSFHGTFRLHDDWRADVRRQTTRGGAHTCEFLIGRSICGRLLTS